MKKIACLLLMAAVFASCRKQIKTEVLQEPDKPIPAAEIDQFIQSQIEKNQYFEWKMAGDEMVWSAAAQKDKIISIGYKPAGVGSVDGTLQNININTDAWKAAKQQVLQIIYETESPNRTDLQIDKMEIWQEDVLPVIDVEIRNLATIRRLRQSGLVRYVEPMGYEPKQQTGIQSLASSSGCGSNNAEPGLINGVDYTIITPNAKQSWNYNYHGVSNAWNRSTGAGVKVFIIDTGLSPDQVNMNGNFNSGASAGRTVERLVTLPRNTFLGIPIGSIETPDDGCGHGTSMAGACAAPRSTNGNAVGVAYNCNLVVCRAAADVYLDESRESKGVADAFTNAANRTDVKIISMSMGRITSSGQISDAIQYAYGKGKLIFCAAGTSFSWTSGWFGVIFPATMNTEVNAVTGVRDNNYNNSCTTCHDGSQTDFTVVMEKAANERHPLSVPMIGNDPSTVGGSSVATATTAGFAALVWSRYPTYTRAQVLDKLISSSSKYPTKSGSLGWGNVNVDLATQ